MGMKCRLVMEDWRQIGKPDSIYNTQEGLELSGGDLHSGTTFEADIELPEPLADEITAAMEPVRIVATPMTGM